MVALLVVYGESEMAVVSDWEYDFEVDTEGDNSFAILGSIKCLVPYLKEMTYFNNTSHNIERWHGGS